MTDRTLYTTPPRSKTYGPSPISPSSSVKRRTARRPWPQASTSATPTTPSAAVTDWQLSAIEVMTESGLMLAHSSALLFKPPAKLRGWRGLIAQCRQMTDTPGHLHNEQGERVDWDLSESPRPGRYIYKASESALELKCGSAVSLRTLIHFTVDGGEVKPNRVYDLVLEVRQRERLESIGGDASLLLPLVPASPDPSFSPASTESNIMRRPSLTKDQHKHQLQLQLRKHDALHPRGSMVEVARFKPLPPVSDPNMFHWCVKSLSKAIVVSAQKSVDFLEGLLTDDGTEASSNKGVQKRIGS
ncbi:BZ3500_MvSof-1268-A1-R1_Chr11-1g03211 [Microbotryum saponariae]|uniref:BZ3500_MvSof-1268-A1-R1_Chr11-1g03211 protein n=1 Tax=Microbotryum saponariae TaxID=289078 RepID=A0A2X0LB58_9BASI|nr:BZ3501_MvSof-1269-A2-R1_Chr11g02786 [Microbotryum saponariae]SDA03771.1 BZ3500_MvSof-1268-A1-R1_Chr11-1g03211 [Microbotryum saponariae]